MGQRTATGRATEPNRLASAMHELIARERINVVVWTCRLGCVVAATAIVQALELAI